eukprot:1195096-Prorocentrum_minimum.AAC.5
MSNSRSAPFRALAKSAVNFRLPKTNIFTQAANRLRESEAAANWDSKTGEEETAEETQELSDSDSEPEAAEQPQPEPQPETKDPLQSFESLRERAIAAHARFRQIRVPDFEDDFNAVHWGQSAENYGRYKATKALDLVSLYEVPAKKKLSIDNAMPIDDAMKLYEIAEKKENNERRQQRMTVKAHFEYEDILKCQRARAHNLWAIARRKSLQMTRSMLAKRRKQIVRMHYSAYLIQRNFRRWILRDSHRLSRERTPRHVTALRNKECSSIKLTIVHPRAARLKTKSSGH